MNFIGFKYLAIFGAFLLMVGSSIEPSVGVWVVSIGGTLLAVALGRDKSILNILFYIPIGMGWGVFGSEVLHTMWPVPQIAAAFFASMFGAEATFWAIRSFREGSMGEFMIRVLETFSPFKKK